MALGLGLGLGLTRKSPTIQDVEHVSDNIKDITDLISDGSDFLDYTLEKIQNATNNELIFEHIELVQSFLGFISNIN